MKKILTSFLLMAMMAGCVQTPPTAETPEEPPVVEQPEKPVDQEKPEETKYIKKIDETKDWVYINDIHTSDMDFAYLDMKQAILDLEFTSGNELENWFSTIVTYTPEIQDFTINMDSIDAENINSWIQEQVRSKLADPKSRGEHVFKVKAFENEEILSVLIRSCLFLPGSGWTSDTYIYNFDLISGKTLTNEELLEKVFLDNLQVKDLLKHTFEDNYETACDYPVNLTSCYYWQDFDVNDINHNYIFMVDNQLNILWSCSDEQGYKYYKQFSIK